MLRKMAIGLISLSFFTSIFATNLTDESIIDFKHQRKSARKAIILSSIFPGAGQFYISKKSITAYIFPIIEIGLWYEYMHYQNKGDDTEDNYKKYADANYSRARQNEVQQNMISEAAAIDGDSSTPHNIYNELHFSLSDKNIQHFYEDIGKYDKYIFGWSDWYLKYAANGIDWKWGSATIDPLWLGNHITDPDDPGFSESDYDRPNCNMRSKYDGMRQDAEDNYDIARNFQYGIIFNHILASLDAVRVTRKYKRDTFASRSYDYGIKTALIDNKITPVLSFTKRF